MKRDPSKVALVTGAGRGIGLELARQMLAKGYRVLAVSREGVDAQKLGGPCARLRAECADVTDHAAMQALVDSVREAWGPVSVLMNNAGIQPGSQMFGPPNAWQHVLDVNLWGIIHGTQVFAPAMIARGRPGLIINTGSKQGITTPPGDPAYNVSKAAVKAFTEALAHELRTTQGCAITAHLLIPGFVFTSLTARGRSDKPVGAWTAEQTVDFMLERLGAGDFYILCPDNDAPRALDEKRIAWAAGDIIANRPALSRWHPDYAEAFRRHLEGT